MATTVVEPTIDELIARADNFKTREALKRIRDEDQKTLDAMPNWMKYPDAFEQRLNMEAEGELAKLGLTKLRYHISFVPSNSCHFIAVEGTTVQIVYYGKGALDLTTSGFWQMFRDILEYAPRLQRRSELEVRNVAMQRKLEGTPAWQRFKIENKEHFFNMIPARELAYGDCEVTVSITHPKTGIHVSVSGYESKREALDFQARMLLSRKVAELQLAKQKQEDERDRTNAA
jgi:hypothetical protein